MNRSQLVIVSVLIAGFISFDIISAFRYWSAKDSVTYGQDSLLEGRRLVSKIKYLRSREASASVRPASTQAAISQVMNMLRSMGVSDRQVLGFQHLPSVKIEKSTFMRQDMSIQLNQMDMPSVIKSAFVFERAENPFVLTSVHFRSAERSSNGGSKPELWNVELTLSRLTFDLESAP